MKNKVTVLLLEPEDLICFHPFSVFLGPLHDLSVLYSENTYKLLTSVLYFVFIYVNILIILLEYTLSEGAAA